VREQKKEKNIGESTHTQTRTHDGASPSRVSSCQLLVYVNNLESLFIDLSRRRDSQIHGLIIPPSLLSQPTALGSCNEWALDQRQHSSPKSLAWVRALTQQNVITLFGSSKEIIIVRDK
jgi:hypothetical protein